MKKLTLRVQSNTYAALQRLCRNAKFITGSPQGQVAKAIQIELCKFINVSLNMNGDDVLFEVPEPSVETLYQLLSKVESNPNAYSIFLGSPSTLFALALLHGNIRQYIFNKGA